MNHHAAGEACYNLFMFLRLAVVVVVVVGLVAGTSFGRRGSVFWFFNGFSRRWSVGVVRPPLCTEAQRQSRQQDDKNLFQIFKIYLCAVVCTLSGVAGLYSVSAAVF